MGAICTKLRVQSQLTWLSRYLQCARKAMEEHPRIKLSTTKEIIMLTPRIICTRQAPMRSLKHPQLPENASLPGLNLSNKFKAHSNLSHKNQRASRICLKRVQIP